MAGTDIIAEALPGAVGAVTGGGAIAWFAKSMLARMIAQYDKRLEHNAKKLESLSDKINTQATRLAVLESHLEDARRLRIDLEQRVAALRGEQEARTQSVLDELNNLRRDVYVAHERVRALAAGDSEISKIQAPPVIRRR